MGVYLFVCLFFSSGVLGVLSILVCMIHHQGEKQASKQASKQSSKMGHHYLQMGVTHCTTSSYLVPKFLDLIIASLVVVVVVVVLEDFLSSYILYVSPFLLAAGKSATIEHLGVE